MSTNQPDDAREQAIERAVTVALDAINAKQHADREEVLASTSVDIGERDYRVEVWTAISALADAGLLRTEAAPVSPNSKDPQSQAAPAGDEVQRLRAENDQLLGRYEAAKERVTFWCDSDFEARQQIDQLKAERDELRRQVAAVRELADGFEDRIDWSDGRSNYGDNDAWTEAARDLRAALGGGSDE